MDIRRNILFFLGKEAGKTDAKLRMRIRWGKRMLGFSLGHRVEIEHWNAPGQRCIPKTKHGPKQVNASEINRLIEAYEALAQKLFKLFEVNEHNPTVDEFREAFNEGLGKKHEEQDEEHDFAFVLSQFARTEGATKMWTRATYQKFSALEQLLIDYENRTLRKVKLASFDLNQLNHLVAYMRDVKQYRNSTLEKKLSFLYWFFRWAEAHNYPVHPAYKVYKPKLKQVEKTIIFLEKEELLHLYELPIQNEALAQVRDVFCFCCFSGLRYSDVANLKASNVRNDHILITTIKTHDSLKIELNAYTKAILERYKGADLPDGKVLPVISNQKMNDRLKELGKLAGIDTPITQTYYVGQKRIEETKPKYELIGTHTARRTFISNALMLGIPPEIVMKWTGHSDYKAMKPYVAIADKAKAEAMALFDDIRVPHLGTKNQSID